MLDHFSWDVSDAGYHWVLGDPTEKKQQSTTIAQPGGLSPPKWILDLAGHASQTPLPCLVASIPWRSGTTSRNHFHDGNAVFKEFESLSLERGSFQDFANTYGLLGESAALPIRYELEGRYVPSYLATPITIWVWEILWLRFADRLRTLFLSASDEEIRNFVVEIEGQPNLSFEALDLFPRRQFLEWVRENLTNEQGAVLREGLRDSSVRSEHMLVVPTSPQERGIEARDVFGWAICNVLSAHLQGRIEFGYSVGRERRLVMSPRPRDLIGAIWIQFANTTLGPTDLRQCSECPRWFMIEAGQGRRDKTFCSRACQMRAYRRRKGDLPKKGKRR
jgi:hypothetical protein